MVLEELQKRLFNATLEETDLYNSKGHRISRLYINYGVRNRKYWTKAWFEVVNDRLTVFVNVAAKKKDQGYARYTAERYKREIEKQFFEIINDCELERRKVPLHVRLRDDVPPVHEGSMLHQAEALRFMCSMKVSAFFADGGIGKSKPVIDLCVSRFLVGQIKKVLVFCPVSNIGNFWQQIRTWCKHPGLEWKVVGTESMSSSSATAMEAYHYVDSETQLIIDESFMVKSPISKRSRYIFYCANKTSFKVVMTGTPIEHTKDFYMQYAMLSELITECHNYHRFERKFMIMGGAGGDEVIGYKNLDYLVGLLEPYTFQLKKEDCLELPSKEFIELECDLTDRQYDLYQDQKESLIRLIASEDMVPVHQIFGYLTRMHQIACGFYKNSLTGEIEDLGTNKFDLLEQTDYEDGQTIFFCKYLHEIELLSRYLGPSRCAVFTGRNRPTRAEEMDLFRRQERQFFLSTMGSGGVGHNGLEASSRLLFWSSSFIMIHREQCIWRVDRLGQLNPMEIIDTRTKAGIDTKIRKNVARKIGLAEEFRTAMRDKTKLKHFVESL